MDQKAGSIVETGENICAALEWVLNIGTRENGNPIPELLDEIKKLRKQRDRLTPIDLRGKLTS